MASPLFHQSKLGVTTRDLFGTAAPHRSLTQTAATLSKSRPSVNPADDVSFVPTKPSRAQIHVVTGYPTALPLHHRTIAEALAAAPDGATVKIMSGTYSIGSETLRVDRRVRIEPFDDDGTADNVSIYSDFGCTVFSISSSGALIRRISASQRRAEGFKILNQRGPLAPRTVEILSCDAILDNCNISTDCGVGVVIGGSGSASLRRCSILYTAREGVIVHDEASPTITNCNFRGCYESALLVETGADPSVERSIFSNCSTIGGGGGRMGAEDMGVHVAEGGLGRFDGNKISACGKA
jgi:hypothetical protein